MTRTYDDVNRLTLVEDGSSNDIVAVEFDSMTQRLKKFSFQNGTTSNFAYDGFGRVTDLDHKTSTPTTFAGYDMLYDDVGNMLYEEWSHDSGKGHNYTYDTADRLKKVLMDCNDPSAELATPGSQAYVKKVEYNLTDDSDRSSVVTTPYGAGSATVNYTSNSVHEYTVVNSINRTYDANGNLLDDGTNEYAYDYRNQLGEVTRKSDSEVIGVYEYDCLGRRTKKTLEDDSSVRYYHDGHHEIEEYSGGGSLLRKYVYRGETDSIAMLEAPDQADVDADLNTSELVRLFYHCDGRTNVARLTASAQTVVESYESDPYGNVTIKNQAGSSVGTSPVGNPVVFQRRRHDDETGFLYFRNRHYEPQRGLWVQRDPLGLRPGSNWHEFEASCPPTGTDPFGLDKPGCDTGPVKVTDPCLLDCCAIHDKCYADNGCDMYTWAGKGIAVNPACASCNVAVVLCFWACWWSAPGTRVANHGGYHLPPDPNDAPYGWNYDGASGKFVPAPDPTPAPAKPPAPGIPSDKRNRWETNVPK